MRESDLASAKLRPRKWGIAVAAALVAGSITMWGRYGALSGTLGLIAAAAWLFFGSVPRANRHNAPLVAGLIASATLLVTWTTAMFLGVVYAALFVESSAAKDWIPIVLLVSTNVGGVIAVFRSAQTRTETGAALRELGNLRIAVLSAPVIEAAERVRIAKTLEELTSGIGGMLQLSVALSLLPKAVDQASLWALNEDAHEWFICAATTSTSEQQFRQKQLDASTDRAGIVANLAADVPTPPLLKTVRDGDVYLVGEGLRNHPWYLVNPAKDHPAEGIAVVLLRRDQIAIGALCFTWETRVIPTEGSQAKEMIDILARWAQAFGVALDRLYQLREQLT